MPNARRLIAGWISLAVAVGALAVAARVPQPLEVQQVSAGAPRPAVTTPVAPTTVPPTTVVPTTTSTTQAPPPPPPASPTPRKPAAPRATTTSVPPVAAPIVTPPPASVTNDPAPAASSEYALSLVQQIVPAAWLAAVPVHIDVIPGKTSWSSFGGLIEVGDWQLTSSVGRAKFTLAHEWGHQLAWRFGTDVYNGAAPAGFPYVGPSPEEQWADCVAQAFLGLSYPSGGLGACPGDSLSFARTFLNAGPGTPLR